MAIKVQTANSHIPSPANSPTIQTLVYTQQNMKLRLSEFGLGALMFLQICTIVCAQICIHQTSPQVLAAFLPHCSAILRRAAMQRRTAKQPCAAPAVHAQNRQQRALSHKLV